MIIILNRQEVRNLEVKNRQGIINEAWINTPLVTRATIMDKSVETFCKTNAFKLTIILFF